MKMLSSSVMNLNRLLGSALLIVGVGALTSACGSDVATCSSVAALPNADPTFASACPAAQSELASAGYGGDFQAYLTCLQNTGDFLAEDSVCAPAKSTVDADLAIVTSGGGGGGVDSGTTGVHRTPVVVDASVAQAPCALDGACTTAGSTCTIPGAGPCGSDEGLLCDGTKYISDGFPCTASANTACGFGSAASGSSPGCSEMCSCINGSEVCTGDCPDAGPSSP